MDDSQFERLMERLKFMSSVLETISLNLMEHKAECAQRHDDLVGEHGALNSIEAELNAIAPRPGTGRN